MKFTIKSFISAFNLIEILFALSFSSGCSSYDQSVAFNLLPAPEKRRFQNSMLNIFGLDHRPKPKRKDLLSSVYLQELYDSFFNEETADFMIGDSHPIAVEGEILSKPSVRAFNESDAIVSLVNKYPLHRRHFMHDKESGLWFDTREIAPGSSVLSAELRLFKNASLFEAKVFDIFKISIYLIIDHDNQRSRLLDSKTFSHKQGWLMFNVTDAVQDWIDKPDSNLGLYMTIYSPSSGKELHPQDIGLSRSSDKQPFILAFFKSQSHLIHRKKRETKTSEDVTVEKPHNPYYDFTEFVTTRSCQKKSLYVSFKDLGWQDWIIAPEGYAAFYCDGECTFPLTAQMNATNHAIVQNLVHIAQNSAPKASCAPTKLSSIMVLYFDDNSNVILKKYRNMVVKSCGCH